MADDVQDILICTSTDTGSEWTSLSELAAGVVDAKLPIESVDGTVKLDGAASVFTVSTGATDKLTIDSLGRFKVFNSTGINTFFVRNDGNAAVGGNGQPYQRMTIEGSLIQSSAYPAVSAKALTSFSNDGTGSNPSAFGFESAIVATGVERFQRIAHFIANKTNGANIIENHVGFLANISGGTNAYSFYATGSTPSRFEGNIQTPSISGTVGTDASITLGGSFEVRTGTDNEPKLLIDSNGRFKVQNEGATNFFVKPDGNVGINTNGQTYRKVDVGGTLIQSGGRQSSGVVSSLNFDNDGTAAAPAVYGFESSISTVADKDFNRVAHYAAVKPDGDSAIENHIGFFAQVSGGEKAYGFYQSGSNTSNYFEGGALLSSIKGLQAAHAQIELRQQATLKAGDGSEYVPTAANSIATKKLVDDKIVICTTAEYNQISPKLSGTLYCLTD